MKRLFILLLLLIFTLLGCQNQPIESSAEPEVSEIVLDPEISERHNTPIPEGFAGTSNPATSEDGAASHVNELYTQHCSSCHGDSGLGDGPAGQVLNPPASPIALTSQLVDDDYLFWRISEGGTSFGTAMPAWNTTLSDAEIWALIDYMRGLEEALVQPNRLAARDIH